LCSDWSPAFASDFLRALHTVRRGYRAIADPSVRARFVAVASAQAEMRRKIRTFLRGITVFAANLDLLDPVRYGRFALELASHKLLRFVAPFLLLLLLTTSGAAAVRGDGTSAWLLMMQVGFYGTAAAGTVLPSLQRYSVVRVAYYFTMAQCAMLLAWVKYGSGQQQVTWEPSKRQPLAAGQSAATRR
jgi:hypothetical protein